MKLSKLTIPALILLLMPASPAMADSIFEYPTNWRLQNCVSGDGLTAYFTSVSACPSGGLSMPSGSTQEQKDRFWAIVTTAKVANRRVGIYYSGCAIDSFYLEN